MWPHAPLDERRPSGPLADQANDEHDNAAEDAKNHERH